MGNEYCLILRWLRVTKNNLRKLYLNRHLHFLFTKSPTSNHGVSVILWEYLRTLPKVRQSSVKSEFLFDSWEKTVHAL